MRITERLVCVPLVESKDYGGAGIDFDSVNLGKMNSLTALLLLGAITGNSTLLAYAGATRDAKTTAIAFKYRLGAADYKVALADQFGDPIDVAATGLVLTAATFDHRQVAIEFDSDAFTDGKPWLTLSIDSTANPLNVAAVGIGTARYPGHLIPSVI